MSERETLELIEAVEAFAEPVEVVGKTRPLSPDPDDDMILDLAINGRAEALVTRNKKIRNSGAFSGGAFGENERRKSKWRLKCERPRYRSFRCG